MPSSSKLLTSNPPDGPAPAPTYSHICTTPLTGAKLITFAGQIGVDPITRKPAATLSAQVELALSNLSRCLTAAGAAVSDIVKVTQYVVNLHPIDGSRRELYAKFMGGHRPPMTLIGVQSLAEEGYLYEIEVMAVVKE